MRGFFSLPTLAGDTVEFSSLGYISQQVVIPEGGELGRVNLVQPLGRDTVNMADAFVYPWPTRERFKQEFLALGLPKNYKAIFKYFRVEQIPIITRPIIIHCIDYRHTHIIII